MVLWVRCSLIEEVDRLARQLHKLPLEPHIPNLGDIFLAITPVILEEQRDRGSGVPMRTVEREFENVCARYRLWDLERLCGV